ncbi:MAG TPA: PIN domain-containing protein [Thermoprotei archaeon]|nr:PIN domain-containing protein [Thermoprotei archaeon]
MSVFIDTCIFYALLDRGDVNHLDSIAIMIHTLNGKFGKAYTSDYVILETTLLSRSRLGVEVVKAIMNFLNRSGIVVLIVDESIFKEALKLLSKKPKRLSLCDAASIILMEKLDIKVLASFDLKSFRGLVPNIIGKGYYASLSDAEKKHIKSLINSI